jgi:hypothetical protein
MRLYPVGQQKTTVLWRCIFRKIALFFITPTAAKSVEWTRRKENGEEVRKKGFGPEFDVKTASGNVPGRRLIMLQKIQLKRKNKLP